MMSVEAVSGLNEQPLPHKVVARRDSPTIQSILSQKPNPQLSYSRYIMLTDSLDVDEDYEDIAAFLNEGSVDLRTSLFGKPLPTSSASQAIASSSVTPIQSSVPIASASAPSLSSSATNVSSAVPTKQDLLPEKRTGPGRPRGSSRKQTPYGNDEDDEELVSSANSSSKRKHSPPNSAPQKRAHREKDDDEDDEDGDGDDGSGTHGASGGADDTDEIEFKPRPSSTRGAASIKREVRSSALTSSGTTRTTSTPVPGRKVGRPPNSANSSTSSLPIPTQTLSAPSLASAPVVAGAASPQTRRGPGRPPKKQVPLTMPDGQQIPNSQNSADGDEVEIKLSAPVSPLSSQGSQGSQSVLGGESSQDSSQPGKATGTISKNGSSGALVPGKVPKRRGRPRKQQVNEGEEEEEDADASEQAEERSHTIVTVNNPSEFDAVLEYQLKNRASKDTAIFVYLFGNRDARKGESWCPECAQSDPIIKATLAQRPKWVLIECPVGERSEFKNKPEHPYRLHRKVQLKAIPTLIKWGNERPRAQLVEYECHQPKTLEEFILKDKETH